MTDALAIASLFFLTSFAPKDKAEVFAALPGTPILYEVSPQARYYGKCAWEMVRFGSLLVQGRWHHWTPEKWVEESTLRLDHTHIATLEHTHRSEMLMEGFGRYLLWTPQEVHDGKLAAGIHDIGKLVIPTSILEKPSALTPEEMEIMRKHVDWSWRFVSWIPGFERVASIIADHHESYDGTGYPKGSQHREISEATHALAIVDAYDAITNARYYKQAKTQRWAFWELRRCAGRQFDPDLVEAFIAFMGGGGMEELKEPEPYQPPPPPRKPINLLMEQSA
jgi:HD-GYP domain-containing protein (c-di-GMP phosphodiesterase class II)